ncbi:MAG: antitoxin VbhA family protein [Clostridia bacterium]|nr:antitoxin VbhA family protein [Clostridia bacterium]
MFKVISEEKQAAVVRTALFNARMEGFQIPDIVIQEGKQMLRGKITAAELVQQYKFRYCSN